VRIGFDITALYVATGGVFYYDYNLVKTLLELDQENDYLLLDYYPIHGGWRNPPEIADLTAPNARTVHSRGFRHYRLSRWRPFQRPVLRGVARGVDRVLAAPFSALSRAVMRARLPEILDGVDVFHASDVLLWSQPGALNVCTIHDLTVLLFPDYHTEENQALHRAKLRFAQEEADVVIAVSEATKRDIVAHLDIPPERIVVVHNGVSPAFHPVADRAYLAERLADLGLAPQDYLLHVGTLEPRKNLVRLVEAYAQLRRIEGGAAPPLVLVGPIGWAAQDIVARVEALGLKDAVLITGAVPFELVPLLYAGARFFVYPSLYEGFGLPPLEAMACGTPVITSNVSSLPEVVGSAGMMAPPDDTEAIAAAMAALLHDADLRQDMREAGLARASRFSWELAARQTLDVYRRFTD
jgi:glycosyltransferase involved in cell wall biosynthesis